MLYYPSKPGLSINAVHRLELAIAAQQILRPYGRETDAGSANTSEKVHRSYGCCCWPGHGSGVPGPAPNGQALWVHYLWHLLQNLRLISRTVLLLEGEDLVGVAVEQYFALAKPRFGLRCERRIVKVKFPNLLEPGPELFRSRSFSSTSA